MPSAPLRIRLKTSPILRRLVPTQLVLGRAERKARRLFAQKGETHARALRTMEAIVAGTARAGELEQLAERWTVEREAWNAIFWQPWPRPRISERSSELLLESIARGRGVVLSSCHTGPYFMKARTLGTIGVRPYVVSGDWFYEDPSNDYWGRRLARWRRGLPPVPIVRPRGSFDVLAAALRRAETALIYFDMPGRHETSFLGKPVMLVDGTARLAIETGALVMPIRSRRVGRRIVLEIREPLDPTDFDGVDALQDELARIHERLILEDPAAMDDPAEFGWGEEATPSGWRRPAPDGARSP
jgi:lauroyl/myristoyl acyltransferase